MLVRSEKLETKQTIPDACGQCNGVGLMKIIPLGMGRAPFETTCSFCWGEKVISAALIERKILAEHLTDLLRAEELTARAAGRKFGGTMLDWADAKAGRASLADIQEKIDLLTERPTSHEAQTLI